MTVKQFVAVKAFIEHDGKVLILRESSVYGDGTNAGRYDVPGGRLSRGERWDEALLREIGEETGLSVAIGAPFALGEWRPMVGGEEWQVVGVYVRCRSDTDRVTLGGDHDDSLWIHPEEHPQHPLIPGLNAVFGEYLKPQRS